MNRQIDNSIVNLILKSVQEGDLEQIQSFIDEYKIDMKILKDKENQQNAFFYCSLIINIKQQTKI